MNWFLPRLLAARRDTLVAVLAGAGEPLVIKFGSFFAQPVGPRGLEIAEALRAADGREVRLRGYMVSQEQRPAGRFLLTPRPVRMSEHADGEADDLPPSTVTVVLDAAQQDRIVTQQDGLIEVVGYNVRVIDPEGLARLGQA